MAHSSDRWLYNHGVLRLIFIVVGTCLVGYIVAPPLYWHLKENWSAQASCPPCGCDCSSEALFSMPLGLVNSSYSDCGKHDPEMNEELEKDIVDLLSEELRLRRYIANDNLEHTKVMIMEAKKSSSQYQKEAEKCNTGMETCEEAREKAEAAVIQERKLSELWETRARALGWKD